MLGSALRHGPRFTAGYSSTSYLRCYGSQASQPFTVLALESSADDTCAAVVDSNRRILSNVVINQHEVHEEFKGIEPLVALRTHQRNMPLALRRALTEAGVTMNEIDGIAFTRGPGMPGCLVACSMSAKALAAVHNKPLVGVHHMQAHALTALLTSTPETMPTFPFLTLLVSGGHTLLLLARSPSSYTKLASTMDIAVGTAIDKVARMLDVPWSLRRSPGASLEAFAESIPVWDLPQLLPSLFPHSMPRSKDWSFSGVQSNLQRWYEALEEEKKTEALRVVAARMFQENIVEQLALKLEMGLRSCLAENVPIKHVVVSGGVASNTVLRRRLDALLPTIDPDIKAVFPPPALCTDNAVMIGWASMYRFLQGDHDDISIGHFAKWDIETLAESFARNGRGEPASARPGASEVPQLYGPE